MTTRLLRFPFGQKPPFVQAMGVRLISRNLAMGIAMITIAAAAVAGQRQSSVIFIQYVVGEKSPDVVEEVLTGPTERTVRSLKRETVFDLPPATVTLALR